MRAGAFRPALAAFLGMAALMALWHAPPALAHAELLRATPADGDALSEQPGEVRLFFDEPVRAEFDPIKVTDEEGDRVDGDDARTLPDDPDVVVASLDVLPEGPYTVEWRVTSADGDPVNGEFSFSVDASAAVDDGAGAAEQADAGPGGREHGAGHAALLGVSLLGVSLLVGIAVAAFVTLRGR